VTGTSIWKDMEISFVLIDTKIISDEERQLRFEPQRPQPRVLIQGNNGARLPVDFDCGCLKSDF
jgi:hypothetical protein